MGAGEGEETMEIEYIQSVLPPQKVASIPHEDWVSDVSCQIQGFVSLSFFSIGLSLSNFIYTMQDIS